MYCHFPQTKQIQAIEIKNIILDSRLVGMEEPEEDKIREIKSYKKEGKTELNEI